jgi:hypothetical protein
MASWQFLVLTVLLAGVLASAGVYARVLSRTIDHANARLRRIEEALVVANDRLLERSAPGAGESTPAISRKNGRMGYLTIRDLKEIDAHRASYAGGRSSSVSVPNSRSSVNTIPSRMEPSESTIEGTQFVATIAGCETPTRCDEQSTSDSSNGPSPSMTLEACARFEPSAEAHTSSGVQPVNEECVADSPALRDPVETSGEVDAASAVSASDPSAEASADSENRDAPDATSEPHDAPSNRSSSQDSIAKQNRDALLILSNQRRRRRARLGY